MQNTDEQIMLHVKDGNMRTAALLYDRYHVLVYNYYLRRVTDKQVAEDLMQVAFERMIKYRSSYDVQKNFRSWLFTIVRNVAIDASKKKQLNYMDEEVVAKIPSSDSEDSKDKKETILYAIKLLPEEDGEIIRLSKIHGFKYREVANLLNITEANVKVKVHRSMKQLKDILINQLGYEH